MLEKRQAEFTRRRGARSTKNDAGSGPAPTNNGGGSQAQSQVNSPQVSPTTTVPLNGLASNPAASASRAGFAPASSVASSPQSGSGSSSGSSSSSKSGGGGISGGALGGAVVGVAIAVALITFAITFFLMRRKLRRSESNFARRLETAQNAGAAEKGNGAAAAAVVRKDVNRFDKFAQPSLDDASIKSAAFGLLDKIDNHVSNFYRNANTPIGQETLDALAPVASPHLMTAGPSALQQASGTKAAVTFCIAELATSRISPSGEPSQSLLPLNLPHFAGVQDKSRDTQQAVHWSRIFGAYLYRSGEPSYVAQRSRTVNELVSSVSQTFAHWESRQYADEERVRSLTRLFEDAAELGIMLYSQPSSFEFSWANGDKLPALWKTSDEKGKQISPPQCIVESVSLRNSQ